MAVEVGQVSAQALLGRDCGDLQHPGGWIGRGGNWVHAGDGLKVAHHVTAVIAQRTAIDHLAAALQQQQLIKRLCSRARKCTSEGCFPLFRSSLEERHAESISLPF